MTTKEEALQRIVATILEVEITAEGSIAKALDAAYDAGHAAALTPKTTGLPDIDYKELQQLRRAKRKHRAKRLKQNEATSQGKHPATTTRVIKETDQQTRDRWQAWFDGLTKGQ
jgi:hypothetical protein